MRSLITILITLLVSISTLHAETKAMTVRVHEQVSVESTFVKLADIAKLSGNDKLIEKAKKILLGRKPSDATPVNITAGKIIEALMRNGIGRDSVVIDGADSAQVFNADYKTIKSTVVVENETDDTQATTGGQVGRSSNTTRTAPVMLDTKNITEDKNQDTADKASDADTLVDQARELIKTQVSDDLGIEIESLGVSEVIRNARLRTLPKGSYVLDDIVPNSAGGSILGRRAFTLYVKVGDTEIKDAVVTVDILRYADVVVANRKVNANTALTAGDLRLERRGFTTRSENYYTAIEDVVGRASKTTLQADALVIPSKTEPATIIKRGDRVSITVGMASALGEAAEDGAIGSTVKVFRLKPDGKGGYERAAVVFARVTSVGEVEITKN